MPHPFNETYRFGSASWASLKDIKAAGLLEPEGPQIGFRGELPLHLAGDAPMITVGGAGSGKLRDLLAYVVCRSPGLPFLALDPRGELGAISIHVHAAYGEYAYYWNPMRLLSNPFHRCNPLDILKPDSPTFHADCKFIAEGFIALSGGGNSHYFELRAREWIGSLMKARVEMNGRTSLPDLYRVINTIEADRKSWADQLEAMLKSKHADVRRAAAEMLVKQQDTPKEFGAIMGEIYGHFGFLDDPVLLDSLENPDFSLEELVSPDRVKKVFLNIPAEFLSIWSPLVRLFFTVTMLYKARHPARRRVLLLVDEAGQLGKFEALLRAFTYGRGAGLRPWAIFQDIGQIVRNFGQPALQGFLGSAQMRQFFGVRDYETAQLVSNMLGSETLYYDDVLRQEDVMRRKESIVRDVLLGNVDPIDAARDYKHHKRQAGYRAVQQRLLMTPDEVLSMPENRQVLFISGKDLKPVYAAKYPYFSRPEMAGYYLPNPYHPPVDRVAVATSRGTEWRRVISESVPDKLAGFPQYQSGTWSYVEGFKPL